MAAQPTGHKRLQRIGRQGQGTYDCLNGTVPGRGRQAGLARAGRPVPETGEGERVAGDGVLRVVGVPRALQLRSAVDIQKDPVDGERGLRGRGHMAVGSVSVSRRS